MANDVLETIAKRRSIRNFQEREVSPADLHAVLQAANDAPSAHNQQSWRFIVVSGAKKQELSTLVSGKAAEFDKASSALLRMAAKSISSAPVIIAVVNTGELIRHGTRGLGPEREQSFHFFRTMEIQSSAAAVQNLLLAATSLGLSTVWLGVLFLIKDEVLSLLEEEAGEFMAVVPIGYQARPSSGPPKKPVLAKVKYLQDLSETALPGPAQSNGCKDM